jgi:hypothetical protein
MERVSTKEGPGDCRFLCRTRPCKVFPLLRMPKQDAGGHRLTEDSKFVLLPGSTVSGLGLFYLASRIHCLFV